MAIAIATPDTRILAGVTVPDTPLITRSIEYARTLSEPFLFNHVVRSWLFSVVLGHVDGTGHDAEVVAVATLLHDLGLTKDVKGPNRFEVDGANAAAAFVRGQGLDDRRAQLIWDTVALNSTPSIALHKEAEVALSTAGILLDYSGFGFERIPRNTMAAILGAYPRLSMKQGFVETCRHIVETKPDTTYDSFLRDFGEEYVRGYQRPAPTTVDLLLESPFES